MFYTELTFHISPYVEDIADAIIAELGDLGYDSFSYSDDGFKAYIPSKNFNEEQVKSLEILSFFLPVPLHNHLGKSRNREPRLE